MYSLVFAAGAGKRTGLCFKSCEHTQTNTFHSDIHSAPAHRCTHTLACTLYFSSSPLSHHNSSLIPPHLPDRTEIISTMREFNRAYMKEPFQHSSHQHTHTRAHTYISAGGSGLFKETPCFSNRYFRWIRESVAVPSVEECRSLLSSKSTHVAPP